MDIWTLKIFKTVAEEGSVSKAAEKLHCVQSNVTARIKQLEAELEVPLFYRKSRGMVLTTSGEILIPYADGAVRLLRDAARAVRNEDGVSGPLSIGTMESTAAVRMPNFLSDFHRRYPDVRVHVSTGTTEELAKKVLNYTIEGAFVAGTIDHEDIEQHTAFKERLVVITEPKVKSLTKLDHPTFLVFRRGCSYRAVLESWARGNGIIPGAIMELGTLEGILGFVASGMGVTLFPISVVEKLQRKKSVRTHTISEEYGQTPTIFIRRKNSLLTNAMQALINSLAA